MAARDVDVGRRGRRLRGSGRGRRSPVVTSCFRARDGQRDDLALRLGRRLRRARRCGRAPCRSSSAPAASRGSDGRRGLRADPSPATRRVAIPNSPTARSSSTVDEHARRVEQRVALPSRVLGEVLLELCRRARPRSPRTASGRRTRGRPCTRSARRPGDGDVAVVVHLLHELPRELDRLHVRPERTAEDAFEQALDLRFDGAQDSHEQGVRDECSGRPVRSVRQRGVARRRPGANPAQTSITTIVLATPAPARTDAAVDDEPDRGDAETATLARPREERGRGCRRGSRPTSTSGSCASQLQTAVAGRSDGVERADAERGCGAVRRPAAVRPRRRRGARSRARRARRVRRDAPCSATGMRASGTSGSRPTAASSGPATNQRPWRASRQFSDEPAERRRRRRGRDARPRRSRAGRSGRRARARARAAGRASRRGRSRARASATSSGRPEREERRAERRGDDCRARPGATRRAWRRAGATGSSTSTSARFSRGARRSGVARGVPQLRGEIRARRASTRVEREGRVHRGDEAAGKSAPLARRAEARRPGSPARPPGSACPRTGGGPVRVSQRRTPTDQTSLSGCRVVAGQPLGRDVRERSRERRRRRSACRRRRTARGRSRAAARRSRRDPRAGCSRASRRGARFPRGARARARRAPARPLSTASSSESDAGANRVAHRAARHVLVRDVDVARVVADVVGAHAAVVAQAAGGERLALGACGGLALARDDLQRDVEAVLLVEREPDRARAAGSERSHGPVAPEDELLGGRDGRDGGHR